MEYVIESIMDILNKEQKYVPRDVILKFKNPTDFFKNIGFKIENVTKINKVDLNKSGYYLLADISAKSWICIYVYDNDFIVLGGKNNIDKEKFIKSIYDMLGYHITSI